MSTRFHTGAIGREGKLITTTTTNMPYGKCSKEKRITYRT